MDEQQHETAVTGFLEKLKNRGLRLTAQREVLFRVIAENIGIPSTVQDIWGKTRDLDPSIGIATVYRTINLLAEMGVVNVIYLNEGQFRLEMPEQKLHVSAFCRHCGSLFPLGERTETGNPGTMAWGYRNGTSPPVHRHCRAVRKMPGRAEG